MNNEFTEKLKAFFDLPEDKRDYAQGNTYLLQLTGNKIMYRNIGADPQRYKDHINYQLQKFYQFRLQNKTHEEVEAMQAKADKIVKAHVSLKEENPAKDFKKGQRADHDKLPAEIQSLYVENLSILRKMREIHLELRKITEGDKKYCHDSDRYPFLKELIELDTRYHKNWEKYDHYTGKNGEAAAAEDARVAQKKAYGTINLLKGRYAKNPTEKTKAKILENYHAINNPTQKLKDDLNALGIETK